MFNTAITFDLVNQDLSGGAAVNDDISSIENVIGTNGNDAFFDGTGTNALDGGAGNDTFVANTGANVFNGGGGSDTIDYSLFLTGITFDLAAQDLSGGAAVNDDISSIENAIGTRGSDTFISSTADNIFTGGTGADSFEFAAASSGNDAITDFSSAQGDTISLAGAASFADLDITQVGADAVINLGSGNTLTLEGTNVANLTAADFGFGSSGSAILDRDGSATAERSNVSSAAGDESEDTFVFVTSASLPPVSYERDSFGIDLETSPSDTDMQAEDYIGMLDLDQVIGQDAFGLFFIQDDFLV